MSECKSPMRTPNNASSPADWVHPERAKFPKGAGWTRINEPQELTQPEHGMNKPLPNTAVPQRVKGWRAMNPATTSESNARSNLRPRRRGENNKVVEPTTSVVGGRHKLFHVVNVCVSGRMIGFEGDYNRLRRKLDFS